MAFALVNSWKNQSSVGTGALTVTVSGATANNLLISAISVRVGGDSFTAPTGWTEIQQHGVGSFGFACYYRISSGTSADDCAFSYTDNGLPAGVVIEVSGNATSSVLVQSSLKTTDGASTVSSHTTNSLTPTAANLLAGMLGIEHNFNWYSPTSSITTSISSPFAFGVETDTGTSSVAYAAIGYYEATDATSRSVTFSTTDAGDQALSAIAEFSAAAGGGTEISATTDALTLTEFQASVNAETSISATVDSLTLTEFAATVSLETNISATTDALTLTEYQATVQAGNNTVINANTDALTLTAYQANVNAETNIAANTDALTVTEYQASISQGVAINASVDALTLTEFQATVALENTYINASVDALTLNEFPASINYTGEAEQTFTGGFNVYNRIKTEKEKRQERIEMGIIEDLPKPQQEAVKKAARTENKAVAKSVLSNEIARLEGDIERELLQQKTNELIDAYQGELKQILDEISQEQQALIEFNQRNQNAVAVLMMMN